MFIDVIIILFSIVTIAQFIKASFFRKFSKERELEAKRYFNGSLSNSVQDSSFGLAFHKKDGKYKFSKQSKNRPTYILSNS